MCLCSVWEKGKKRETLYPFSFSLLLLFLSGIPFRHTLRVLQTVFVAHWLMDKQSHYFLLFPLPILFLSVFFLRTQINLSLHRFFLLLFICFCFYFSFSFSAALVKTCKLLPSSSSSLSSLISGANYHLLDWSSVYYLCFLHSVAAAAAAAVSIGQPHVSKKLKDSSKEREKERTLTLKMKREKKTKKTFADYRYRYRCCCF